MSAHQRRRLTLIAGLTLALAAGAAASASEKPPARKSPGKQLAAEPVADVELLEFLGGADGALDGGADWLEFLSSTDIRKIAGVRK